MNNFRLMPIENEGKRVLTTTQLAEYYETTEKRISENFTRNEERYIESKHFYCLTGDELKEFLYSANCGLQNSSKIRTLYLWTEKGALLHAKSLNTDKAWEVYDFLVENYFRVQKVQSNFSTLSPQLQFMIQMEQRQNELEQRQKALENKLDADRTITIQETLSYGRINSTLRKEISTAVKVRSIEICHFASTFDKVGKRVIANIYKSLQKHFNVASYNDLTFNQYTDALIFIKLYEPDTKLSVAISNAIPKVNMSLLNSITEKA